MGGALIQCFRSLSDSLQRDNYCVDLNVVGTRHLSLVLSCNYHYLSSLFVSDIGLSWRELFFVLTFYRLCSNGSTIQSSSPSP